MTNGIHQAMEFLLLANWRQEGDCKVTAPEPPISAAGKHVVIIGGGDTGADCLGTSHRHGAASVTQLEIMCASEQRAAGNPWPQYSMIYRVSSAHEEGGERVYSVNTERFVDDGDGNVAALLVHEVELRDGRFEKIEGTDRELPADLGLLAMGFVGPERALADQLGVSRHCATSPATPTVVVPGVLAGGDGRGQSLTWAIAEAPCAAAVDRYPRGTAPRLIAPTDRPLM